MAYRQRGGRQFDAEPWIGGNNSWGNQPMWQGGAGGHHGGQGYGHHPQGGYGNQGHNQGGGGYYPPGPPQRQPPRHNNYQQPNRGYNQRPPQQQLQQQQQHQGQNRGVKRPAQQNFNNGVTVVKRLRGARGSGGRGPQKAQVKKEQQQQPAKDECVVLDDTEKKASVPTSNENDLGNSQEGTCKICQEKFDGTYNQHKLTKPHREKRAQKYPSCGPCGLKFNGDDARQRYEVHLGSKAHMQVVETAELDVKEGQEPEGTELCEPIEAVMCTLCECVFKKEFVETHCKTKGHLKRITKKKAEAERAAKKAEEEAKKAAGGEAKEGEATEENGEAAEENGDEAEDDGEEDFAEEEEEAEGQEAQEADTAADEAAAPEEELPSTEANASEDATPAEEAEPAAEPETPAPEPVKATPSKRGTARRGRGRGRK